ncbi:MAG: B12-binding domain-containing radical SAM protein [Oscillospiraceae bacterium]|nr:B12-binding domain-containing radical SAM protein [Oscillospiraceae bacterium]
MNILLTALSAKHIHKTLAPWCLKAYCDTHVPGVLVEVQEHTINNRVGDIVADIYLRRPDVVGFSCYIWNIEHVVKTATLLKKLLPACIIVLGGPEVSFEADCRAYPFADFIIQGAGEVTFAKLVKQLMTGNVPDGGVIHSDPSSGFDALPSPYTEQYFRSFAEGPMRAIQNQLVYYESSRGCPFSCTYCLTSTFCGVQELPLDRVRSDIDRLLQHGAACIKFVDRTFNANRRRALDILRYILALDTDCTFHFEVAADLFDAALLQVVSQMPPRRVQFEIGIQSIHVPTLDAVRRSTNTEQSLAHIRTLTGFGNCHIHVDLIAGLPFETMDSFVKGIDACLHARPHMLQLGFLKLLKGTALRENRRTYGYLYNDYPPYEVFQSHAMSFSDMIQLKQIEAVIDKFYNNGTCFNTVTYAMEHVFASPYRFFAALADFNGGANLSVSPKHAYTLLFHFLCQHTDPAIAAHYVKLDCLTFHTKGVLPDEIPAHRDRTAEHTYKQTTTSHCRNIRIEHFEHDGKTRVFLYDKKDAMTQAYGVVCLL